MQRVSGFSTLDAALTVALEMQAKPQGTDLRRRYQQPLEPSQTSSFKRVLNQSRNPGVVEEGPKESSSRESSSKARLSRKTERDDSRYDASGNVVSSSENTVQEVAVDQARKSEGAEPATGVLSEVEVVEDPLEAEDGSAGQDATPDSTLSLGLANLFLPNEAQPGTDVLIEAVDPSLVSEVAGSPSETLVSDQPQAAIVADSVLEQSAEAQAAVAPLDEAMFGTVPTEATQSAAPEEQMQILANSLSEPQNAPDSGALHRSVASEQKPQTAEQSAPQSEIVVGVQETASETGQQAEPSAVADVEIDNTNPITQSQSLREKNGATETTANPRAQSTERQQNWNFHQIMAEQSQQPQPTTLPAMRPAGGSMINQQISRWLQELDVSHVALRGGQVTQMEMTLEPRNLGRLVLKLEMENGELRAYFATQSQIVKESLESQMTNLKDMLQQQGLQVSQLNVQIGNEPRRQGDQFQEGSFNPSSDGRSGTVNAIEGNGEQIPVQRVSDLWNRMTGSRLNHLI